MGDNRLLKTYAAAMAGGEPYIEMKLQVPGAVELGDFVSAFTALASEYERYVTLRAPKAAGQATLFIREVRQGSIVALLFPWFPVIAGLAEDLKSIAVIEEFIRRYGGKLSAFLGRTPQPPPDARPAELRDWSEQVAVIANSPN